MNTKENTACTLFTAGMFLCVLYRSVRIESSNSHFVIAKVLSDPQTHIGQKVKFWE
jgi:hypothetical protein